MTEALVDWERADRIATITLNNPPVNALSMGLLDDLHAAFDAIEKERGVRVVILRGGGERAFCAGADIREESTFNDPAEAKAFRFYGRRTLERIENYPKPIVAEIQGYWTTLTADADALTQARVRGLKLR